MNVEYFNSFLGSLIREFAQKLVTLCNLKDTRLWHWNNDQRLFFKILQVKLNVNVSVEYPGSFASYCEAWDNNRNNVSCFLAKFDEKMGGISAFRFLLCPPPTKGKEIVDLKMGGVFDK